MLKLGDLKGLIRRYVKIAAKDNDEGFYLPLFVAGEKEYHYLTHENFFKLMRQIPKFLDFDGSVPIAKGEKIFYTSSFAYVVIKLMYDKAKGYIAFHIATPTEDDPESEIIHYFNEGTEAEEFMDECEQELENGIDEGL